MAVFNAANEVQPLAVWPEDFKLGGSESSAGDFLRRLIEAFPNGQCRIEDVHEDRRWLWEGAAVRSILMAPLQVRGKTRAYTVLLGPEEEVYTKNHANLLNLAAIQASFTLERAANFQRTEESLRRDPVSGLLNHRIFQERLREEIVRCGRYGKPLSLLMLDVDGFRAYNDRFGYAAGDEWLRRLAAGVRSLVRNIDAVFRYGGKEICVLLPETDGRGALKTAQRIQGFVRTECRDASSTLGVSMGAAEWVKEEAAVFVSRVEGAVAKAKELGGDRIHLVPH
jgi:diguanylate cyclase (GGDEF)-like protein